VSALGSLYIKLGEPDGELCGCTCEVGDWAAGYIVDLTKQRDKLVDALAYVLDTNLCTGDDGADARQKAYEVIAEVKGSK